LRIGNRTQGPAVSRSARLAFTERVLRLLRRQALLPLLDFVLSSPPGRPLSQANGPWRRHTAVSRQFLRVYTPFTEM